MISAVAVGPTGQAWGSALKASAGPKVTYPGNYTQLVAAKVDQLTAYWAAYEKQQKYIHRRQEMVQRLSGGASSRRASIAERELERLSGANAPDAVVDNVKTLLGRMLFPMAAMERRVALLSGGEKARLALAKFNLSQRTLLVLDEPTNHLDIRSKEMLEEAVTNFEGSMLAVTHDRYLLKKLAI
ncbi:hypothetical protein WJX73_002512 [Symbiochloris irregularis]|uniref:ABC-transporter extension domain-containing protein n=1 Tax=Symbiochloris irregularis TaxID=706552 RepID=A0AAW1NWE4_9CHLO